MGEPIDATATSVAEAPLVPTETARDLFGASDPIQVLAAAKRVAAALKAEIAAAGMVQQIGGRSYVRVEGWGALAAMLGITPSIAWSRPIEGGFEARCEVRAADGRLIGAGESQCTRAERTWARRDDYAIRSMAQTRAVGRALRVVLAFVMVLSGHAATPAEEIPDGGDPPTPAGWAQPAADQELAAAAHALVAILKAAGVPDPGKQTAQLGQRVREQCGGAIPRAVASLLEHILGTIQAAGAREGADW